MGAQVEVGAVGDALDLRPAPGEAVLDVRGGFGVVGELVWVVWPQAQAVLVDTERGVPAHALPDPRLVPLLVLTGLYEELDLHHLELAGAEYEVAGGDLVTEGLADLRDAEGGPSAGGGDDVVEVYEDTLGGLRPEEGKAAVVLDGSEAGREHLVEVTRLGEIAAAVGAAALFELVLAPAHTALPALDERVREVVGVAAGPPHVGVHQNGGVQADHVVAAPDEVLPPGALDVVLELDAQGSVVPGAG